MSEFEKAVTGFLLDVARRPIGGTRGVSRVHDEREDIILSARRAIDRIAPDWRRRWQNGEQP